MLCSRTCRSPGRPVKSGACGMLDRAARPTCNVATCSLLLTLSSARTVRVACSASAALTAFLHAVQHEDLGQTLLSPAGSLKALERLDVIMLCQLVPSSADLGLEGLLFACCSVCTCRHHLTVQLKITNNGRSTTNDFHHPDTIKVGYNLRLPYVPYTPAGSRASLALHNSRKRNLQGKVTIATLCGRHVQRTQLHCERAANSARA